MSEVSGLTDGIDTAVQTPKPADERVSEPTIINHDGGKDTKKPVKELEHEEKKPRTITTRDVEKIQKHFLTLQLDEAQNGGDFLPSASALYEALTTQNVEGEPDCPEEAFDKTTSSLLEAWRKRKDIPEPTPTTLRDIENLFEEHPGLNDEKRADGPPLNFQEGANTASGRFIHVKTGRVLGVHSKLPVQRYYLNPRADKMGAVVDRLASAALENNEPLYFKFVNLAKKPISNRALTRQDRVVVYASEDQKALIESLCASLSEDDPGIFAGRETAGFTQPVTDGISIGADVTKEQNAQHSGMTEKTSFNDIRTKLMFDATQRVTADIVSSTSMSLVRIGNKTAREIFIETLNQNLRKSHPEMILDANDPTLRGAFENRFDFDALEKAGLGPNARRSMEDSLLRTAKLILPKITSDSLLPWYQLHTKQLAAAYGINPDNLAENLPAPKSTVSQH